MSNHPYRNESNLKKRSLLYLEILRVLLQQPQIYFAAHSVIWEICSGLLKSSLFFLNDFHGFGVEDSKAFRNLILSFITQCMFSFTCLT